MKTRKNLILFSGIVAALLVVWAVWYISEQRSVASIAPIPVSSVVEVRSVDTTCRPVGIKKVRKSKIVQRYDEHGAR